VEELNYREEGGEYEWRKRWLENIRLMMQEEGDDLA
jgi:hypothetical protein